MQQWLDQNAASLFGGAMGTSTGGAASAATPYGEQQDPDAVYFGRRPGEPTVGRFFDESGKPKVTRLMENEEDDVKSVAESMAMFYEDDFDLNRLGEMAEKYGMKAETLDDLMSVWESAVQYSANKFAAGSRKTPWEMIPLMAGAWRGDGSPADRSRALAESLNEPRTVTSTARTAGRTITETATQVDISNPEQSRALVQDVLSQALGRWASGAELAEFVGTLNTYQRENPSTSTRTTTTTPQTSTQTTTESADGTSQSSDTSTVGGESSSSVVNQQGASAEGAQQLLLENAMEQPDYGAYQASSTYFTALLGALAAPV
jgi:hypothetical protein